MLQSNAESAFSNLVKVVEKYRPDDKLLSELTFEIYAENNKRVHQEGKGVDGSPIGSYSTKPIYVNPQKSPVKFTPKGKTGGAAFKNGKRRRTRFFEGGYKGFKKDIGRLRETDNVNLKLFGDLQRGFLPEKRGNRWVIGIVSKQVGKYSGLVERYGEFYGVGKREQEIINKILAKRLQQIK